MDVQSIPALECLPADFTGVYEHAGKVDCLKVISDFGWKLCLEDIANRAVVFLDGLIADYVLAQVIRT